MAQLIHNLERNENKQLRKTLLYIQHAGHNNQGAGISDVSAHPGAGEKKRVRDSLR